MLLLPFRQALHVQNVNGLTEKANNYHTWSCSYLAGNQTLPALPFWAVLQFQNAAESHFAGQAHCRHESLLGGKSQTVI